MKPEAVALCAAAYGLVWDPFLFQRPVVRPLVVRIGVGYCSRLSFDFFIGSQGFTGELVDEESAPTG
jgi:hypothetical protein